MSLKTNIAIKCAGLSRFVLQTLLRRPGAFYPGKIALKIDNQIIEKLKDKFDLGTVLVTGTNGKTSVTGLTADCVRYEGVDVCWNKTGANLASGIAAAMLEYKPKKNTERFGVFEVDELWVEWVLPQTKSKYLLLLNLFPDQVDRFGSIENIQKSLIHALNQSPDTVLIYNCDDPNCQIIADKCENNTVPFGVDEKISKVNEVGVNQCPICGYNMNYKLHQYAMLGNYRCPNCGFNRAEPQFSTTDITLEDSKLEFCVNGVRYKSSKAVEYACYNLTAFIAMAACMQISDESIDKAIKFQRAENGRMEYFEIGGRTVMINLAKNPVGFNQNINYIMDRYLTSNRPTKTTVAFFANAREGDGKSTAWLRDVDFDKLASLDMLDVYYGGEAAKDLEKVLRNKDIRAKRVENAKAVLKSDMQSKKVYIIANYTAMFPLRDELSSLASQ